MAIADADPFSIDNVPFGVARLDRARPPRVVVRLGDHVLDLSSVGIEPTLTAQPSLNALIASGRALDARAQAIDVLREGTAPLTPVDDVEMVLPVSIGDYVDFYSSLHHATNLGRLFRPDSDPLLPNWRRLPVGYHGRAGTVVVSGTPIARPSGLIPDASGVPALSPSRRLDIELEVGFIVGREGSRIAVDDADQYVFGAVLVNDWSARDVQAYEYQPLGPHLGKSFATTISPWVVTLDALRAFFVEPPVQDPAPDAYLRGSKPWGIDLELEVELNGTRISSTNFDVMYWTFAQQLAHMTVNGARVRVGDLFASGTVSGPEHGELGSLVELSWGGREPIGLADGSTRTFLEDGDEVVLRGACGDGRIGFGECAGKIVGSPTTS